MARRTIRLPCGSVLVVDVDETTGEAKGTMVQEDGSTTEYTVRGDDLTMEFEDGCQWICKIKPDGTIRLVEGIMPDGSRHPCDIEI